jgi:tripartite-type tricarboxylate transporter receptor subunit TctC
MQSFARFAFSCALACAAIAAEAQNFPVHPLRIVLGFPPGGGVDLVARILAPKLTESLGQQVIVDNRPGANGLIGTEIAAKAAPDGHTLFLGTTGNLSVNPTLYANLKLDIGRAFAPVTLVSSVPFLLYIHPALSPRTVAEFVAYAKARPGRIYYYSGGNGGLPHLAGELLNNVAGLKTVHVPYKGAAPGLTDLMGGQVQYGFGAVAIGLPQVKAGRLRVLATTGPKRLAFLPEIAAMNETLSGFEVVNWYGMVVPAGTPRQIVVRLNAELIKAMSLPEIAEKLIAQGTEPAGTSPEAFGVFMKAETAKWAPVIKSANIRAD